MFLDRYCSLHNSILYRTSKHVIALSCEVCILLVASCSVNMVRFT